MSVAGATVAASVTYVIPIVSTALGVVVLHEELHWYEPVGGAVVLGGVALTQWGPPGDAQGDAGGDGRGTAAMSRPSAADHGPRAR